ncbi:MAG: VWA domain-containing protein [Pyrinomonadaceae bacterium]|nr:VWA domain-containing protein [Pyrinomonadaceae bacterium]MBP6212130.1 VWA domain-containing protein [Pyrinomonadaceae bacterium]
MNSLKTAVQLTVALLAFCCASNITAQTVDDAPIKVNTVLLNVPVVVSDKDGRNITGLKKEDFSVYQEGVKQTIEFFANTEEPMNFAILIDTSKSTIDALPYMRKAAKSFLGTIGPQDKGMVLSSDYEITTLSKLTSSVDKLRGGIDAATTTNMPSDQAPVPPGTLFDAIYRIINKDFAGEKGRKAIVILTDGFEIGKKISAGDLITSLTESDTIVYPIIFVSRGTISLLPKNLKTVTLDEILNIPPANYMRDIANVTGGRVYSADTSDFSTAFQKIADELKRQYVIGFYPTNAEGGKSANITIKVNRDGAVVRSKKTIRLKPRTPDGKKKDK